MCLHVSDTVFFLPNQKCGNHFCSLHFFFVIGTIVYHYSWQNLGVKPTKHVICQRNMKQIEYTMEVGLMMSYNLISCRIEDTSYFLDNRKNIQLHP
jgi:hypothetical protein